MNIILIVDNVDGRIYKVLERYGPQDAIILLDKPWTGNAIIWVVPPPINRGRGPCVAVYQKVIRF